MALFVVLAASGCDHFSNAPISVAAHVWQGYEPTFLAQREKWLDAGQVHLTETASASASLDALASGKADAAALTLDEVLRARAGGIPLTVVMVFDISAGADKLVARPEITTLEKLKGKTIGFEQGAVGELMLSEALRTAGLTRQDIVPLQLTVDQQLDAWAGGRLDACVTYEPVAGQLQARGAVALFDSRQVPNVIVDVLAVRTRALDPRHDDAIRHLVSGHLRAVRYFQHSQQDAIYRMAGHLKLRAADVLPAFKGMVLPDTANNHRLLEGAAPELLASARKLSAVMVKNGLLQTDDDLNGLISADFLPPIAPAN